MKILILLSTLFSITTFAQDYGAEQRREAMHNSCMSAWHDLRANAATNEDKDALCNLPPFSYCIVNQRAQANGRILNFNVESCFNNLFNPSYPAEERKVDVQMVCRHAWLRLDGVINYSREEVCKKPHAAACIANLVVNKQSITTGITTACIPNQERNELRELGIFFE